MRREQFESIWVVPLRLALLLIVRQTEYDRVTIGPLSVRCEMAGVIRSSDEYSPEPKRPLQQIPLTPQQIRRLEDADWARCAPEVQNHVDKFVAIRDKRVIAVGTEEVALRRLVAELEHCSIWDMVVEFVYSPESLLNMDFSPDFM